MVGLDGDVVLLSPAPLSYVVLETVERRDNQRKDSDGNGAHRYGYSLAAYPMREKGGMEEVWYDKTDPSIAGPQKPTNMCWGRQASPEAIRSQCAH